ncbi:glycosyl transferase family 2 [Breoghania corrubedonensis]|uniref:Glycosyl transferase family 2 n=2 Tax=Breoghania corrubedonensis TaxID=665038 RepID=A0A2T5UU66_9HYPH|nr:glycosyl transferase family 2 [Breoghania corrubedonensis]
MQSYSAIIPAFNAAAFIGDAIASIRAQTVQPAQIIVVDDGSSDGTANVVRGIGDDIVILHQENRGVGAATTAGFAVSRAPLLATLDSDDLWLPNKMEAQLARLAEEASLCGVFAHIQPFRPADGQHASKRNTSVPGWLRTTMVIRREAFTTIGPIIDPPGGCGDMVDWLARVREGGHRLTMLEDTLALRRIRPGSLSSTHNADRDGGYLYAARQAILRKRAGQD